MKPNKLDTFFMNTAIEVSKLSNCVSYRVGAVIVKDNRIISTGYNGTPSGFIKNCNEVFCEKDEYIFPFPDTIFNYNEKYQSLIKNTENIEPNIGRELHHDFSKTYEIHAEMNAILFAAKNGISINNTVMYVTVQPCDYCIKNLTQSGIKKVIYLNDYDRSTSVEDNLILSYGLIKIEKYENNS